ncbi:hypothetical protein Tsubulata_041216, partial [Turnera subulata]
MLRAHCSLEDNTACAIRQSGAPLHRTKFENTVSAFETLPQKGDLSEKELLKILGNSMEFIKSADNALKEKSNDPQNLSDMAEEARRLADCDYENGTSWGTE